MPVPTNELTGRPSLTETRCCFIDGNFVHGSSGMDVENPATEETITEVAAVSVAEVDTAIVAARRAFDQGPWPQMSTAERATAIGKILDHLEARSEHLTNTLIEETGCPSALASGLQVGIPLAHGREVPRIFQTLPEYEHNPLPLEEVTIGGRVVSSVMLYEPVGVVAAIAAYNFPLFTSLWKVLPALMAGNTVVLRPSPLTPLAVMELGAAAATANLPPGVLNVVVEPGSEAAQLMTTHPAVDLVSFTGSTAVGSEIIRQGAVGIKKMHLELGGKSVQLYLPGSLERAVHGITSVFRAHAGQGCVLQTRVLIPHEAKAEVLDRVVDPTRALRIGDPTDPSVEVGPLISEAQVEKCASIVAQSVRAGGHVVVGGARPTHPQRGHFFEPTVLDVPSNDNPAAQQEIFGPVVTVIGYDSLDHAVAIANDSTLGLSGGVFGPTDQALALARRIRSGAVNVNSGVFSAWASSGGWKQSGIGRERGREGIRAFQQVKHIGISS